MGGYRRHKKSERGAALLVVIFVCVIMLVGGVTLIAVTNSQLSDAGSYRQRTTIDACAQAAVERIRTFMPTIPEFNATEGTLEFGSSSLTYRAGHYDGDVWAAPVVEVSSSEFDVSSLYQGENITNVMGTVTSGVEGLRVMTTTAVCEDAGAKREVQLVFRYGVATGAR